MGLEDYNCTSFIALPFNNNHKFNGFTINTHVPEKVITEGKLDFHRRNALPPLPNIALPIVQPITLMTTMRNQKFLGLFRQKPNHQS